MTTWMRQKIAMGGNKKIIFNQYFSIQRSRTLGNLPERSRLWGWLLSGREATEIRMGLVRLVVF